MWYVEIEKPYEVKPFCSMISKNQIIVFKNEPNKQIIDKSLAIIQKTLNQLENDRITWCKGILLSGTAEVKMIKDNYLILSSVVYNQINIIYIHGFVRLGEINYKIRDTGALFIGYKDGYNQSPERRGFA